MVEHEQTTAYRLKLRQRILTTLSPVFPSTYSQISAQVGKVSNVLLYQELKYLIKSGEIVEDDRGLPHLYFRYDPEVRINKRGKGVRNE